VYLAARGPRILQLAGEVADGAILGGFAQPAGLRYALDMVDRGVARAGRDRADVDVLAWLYVSVDDDPVAAVPRSARSCSPRSSPAARSWTASGRAAGRAARAPGRDRLALPRETAREAADLLPDHIVDAFAVHGTPAQVRRRLDAVRGCGIDHVSFVLFRPREHDRGARPPGRRGGSVTDARESAAA